MNSVYKHTHNRLAAMVSARAAKRALRNALKSEGLTPDNVSVSQMINILKSSIFKEFQLVLPADGLKKNLSQLMSELKTLGKKRSKSAPASDEQSVSETDKDETPKETNQEKDMFKSTLPEFWFEDPEDKANESENNKVKVLTKEKEESPSLNKNSNSPIETPVVVSDPLDKSHLEEIVLHFAQLENVKLVAALRQKGEVVVSRGSGIDLGMFSRVGIVGLRLLQKGGSLKSYYLSHACGQLFLLAFGQDIILVLGSSELNLGEVFANASALKEKS